MNGYQFQLNLLSSRTSAQLTPRDRVTAVAVPTSEKFTVQLCALYFSHDVIQLS